VIRTTALAVLTLAANACWGQDDARKIIEHLSEHYRNVQGCSVTLTMDVEFPDGAPFGIGDMDQTSYASVLKPNIFAFWPGDKPAPMGMPVVRVMCDGKQLVTAMPNEALYSSEDAPATLAELVTAPDPESMMPAHAWEMIAGAQMVIDLMSDVPDKGIVKMLSQAEYKGVQGEDAQARHVFLATEQGEFGQSTKLEIFVAAGDKPWVTAIKPQIDQAQQQMFGKIDITLRFDDWKAIEALPEAARFKIADEWKKVDNVIEAAMNGLMTEGPDDLGDEPRDDGPDQPKPPAADKGNPAPDFTLTTLDESTFTLSSLKGKVVVLDFWATWCGPCVRALPTVTSVTADYADKGVVFAAVNLREKPERVRKFMADKEWSFNVPMDTDGSIAQAYGVTGIPHSVIIDKQGIIRHIHVGFGGAKQYEAQLRAELDELIKE